MKNIIEMRKGLEAKREIEAILKKYEATLYYENDEGCITNDISLYKREYFDVGLDIKDYGKLKEL